MRKLILIKRLSLLFLMLIVLNSNSYAYTPEQGDIIFHTSGSNQSLAIQKATHSVYSHMGIVLFKHNQAYVFEASNVAKFTPLNDWIARGESGAYVVKRLTSNLTQAEKDKLYNAALSYQGKPYDLTFEWSDHRMYCSELVWKVYYKALGIEIGQLQKLKEFDLSSREVKAKILERYGKNIPLNENVISPKAMFESNLLKTVGGE